MSSEQPDKIILGEDLVGFWLQPGFVEGIIADRKSFGSLEKAYRHLFRRNTEYAVFLWNGIPVCLDYREDIPRMVVGLIDMLKNVLERPTLSPVLIRFDTPNLETEWLVSAKEDRVDIEADWKRLAGHYESALNLLGIIRMSRLDFLCEWKLLLEQLVQALRDSETTLSAPSARQQYEMLSELTVQIPQRGRFYHYETREQ